MLDLLGLRKNFLHRKLFRGLADHPMLFGEVFRSKYIGGLPFFQQKAAAENLGLENCSRSHG